MLARPCRLAASLRPIGGDYGLHPWQVAEATIGGDIRYVFVTDGVGGYFFSDSFGNGTIDNGVVLEGVKSLSDFNYTNILG
jgi:hypothetical protein